MTGHAQAGDAQASDADLVHLRAAIELSRLCPRSATAFSVGAIVVAGDGTELATGYSREIDPHDHAEEVALRRLDQGRLEQGRPEQGRLEPDDPRLAGATLYSSLEPCSTRASRPLPCARLILGTPIPRVVFAWREPAIFVDCTGAADLRAAGRTVIEVPALAAGVRAINAHLLPGG